MIEVSGVSQVYGAGAARRTVLDDVEGNGVEPNVTVDVDWTHYSEDDDPQLLEALRILGAGPK